MAAKRKTRKRATKKVAKAAPAPVMAAPTCCIDNEKWIGLGLFFVGAIIVLNGWQAWVTWSALVGVVLAVYGLYHYFRYG